MTTRKSANPTWIDVKAKLADFDRTGLIGLVQRLYAASKDNKDFVHARFGLGSDVLEPYKAIIARWAAPDVYKNQMYSVAKAKKPIADYRKAAGQAEGIAELTVFYCEQAIAFSNEVRLDDGGYYDALGRMFELALKTAMTLPEAQREFFIDRLEDVRRTGEGIGWGVEDDLNELWRRAGLQIEQ